MKLAVALATLLAASVVHAGPEGEQANRKVEPPADKLAAAAGEAFGKARAADEKGDLDEALRLYRKALAISPHPNTLYNIADVQRRKKDVEGAITSYKKYLEMDPAAKDRADVDKLIAKLEAMPGTMIIEIEESGAKVFVEGEPIKVAPEKDKRDQLTYTLDLPAGNYTIDVITAISHDNDTCYVYRGGKRSCRMRLKPRVDGNLIISGPHAMYRASMGYNGKTTKLKQRYLVDPGKQEAFVLGSRERQCKPLIVDVAKGDAVTYVWAAVPDKLPQRRGECVDIKYKQTVLKF